MTNYIKNIQINQEKKYMNSKGRKLVTEQSTRRKIITINFKLAAEYKIILIMKQEIISNLRMKLI